MTAPFIPPSPYHGREESEARPFAVARWLLVIAAMVFAMIVVGGITRLTESGLSITRWQPIGGAIPPLTTEAWQTEFARYQATSEYQLVNRGMTLAGFKAIYFWEYLHRLLGRLIGLAFVVPLAWFAWRRAIPKGFGWRLAVLLGLGSLQGAIGWWMVVSGLAERTDVSHVRLAVHLLTALLIFALALWTALDLAMLARSPALRPARLPTLALWTLSLFALQAMFGAYVAGLDAGHAFASWPLMGERLYPTGAPWLEPAVRNLVDNPVTVQFIHRWLAFLLAALALALARSAQRRGGEREAALLVAAVAMQILLGIVTLLSGVQLLVAVMHQATAVILLAAILLASHRVARTPL